MSGEALSVEDLCLRDAVRRLADESVAIDETIVSERLDITQGAARQVLLDLFRSGQLGRRKPYGCAFLYYSTGHAPRSKPAPIDCARGLEHLDRLCELLDDEPLVLAFRDPRGVARDLRKVAAALRQGRPAAKGMH